MPAKRVEVHAEPVDVEQVISAMERAAEANEAHAKRCMEQLDYTGELFAEDAARLREGIALLRWASHWGVLA